MYATYFDIVRPRYLPLPLLPLSSSFHICREWPHVFNSGCLHECDGHGQLTRSDTLKKMSPSHQQPLAANSSSLKGRALWAPPPLTVNCLQVLRAGGALWILRPPPPYSFAENSSGHAMPWQEDSIPPHPCVSFPLHSFQHSSVMFSQHSTGKIDVFT